LIWPVGRSVTIADRDMVIQIPDSCRGGEVRG
jgi:hypothetical protein